MFFLVFSTRVSLPNHSTQIKNYQISNLGDYSGIDNVDGRHPAPVEYGKYLIIYKVLYIPGGAGGVGFLPSTVPPQPSGHSFDCSARPWRNFFLKVVSRDQGVCQCVRGRVLLGGYIYIHYSIYLYIQYLL